MGKCPHDSWQLLRAAHQKRPRKLVSRDDVGLQPGRAAGAMRRPGVHKSDKNEEKSKQGEGKGGRTWRAPMSSRLSPVRIINSTMGVTCGSHMGPIAVAKQPAHCKSPPRLFLSPRHVTTN